MGAVLARLTARSCRRKGLLKVLYTAHGFHFFSGAPLSYWLTFYPVEKWLSRFTDAIITINQGINENMYPHNDQQKFIEYIVHLHQNPIIRQQMSQAAITTIQKCSIDNALKSMAEIIGRFI